MDVARVWLVLTVVVAVWNPLEVAAQSWSGGASSAPPATSYDRYGQPIAPSPPSISQRAQNAFSDTGSALRDGMEAGIRAGEQSINGAVGTGTTSTSARGGTSVPWTALPTTNATTPNWTSNPATPGLTPLRGASPTVTAIDGGWTSIGTAIAAPPLLVPQSPMATANIGNAGGPSTSNGTSYPAVASNNSTPLHSVLADPARPAATTPTNTPDSWASGWGDNSGSSVATIGRNGSAGSVRDSGLAPLHPVAGSSLPDDSWALPAQPTLGPANGTASASRPVSTLNTNSSPFRGNTLPNSQFASQPNNTQSLNGQNMNKIPRNQTLVNGSTEPQPWMPLIASVLTLAGSLAANLYLGVSYLDARQKYQSLVRKTADTFRRVKAVAA